MLWLDDDHSSEDERPLASLMRPSLDVLDVPSRSPVDDEIQLLKVIPPVVDLLTPPRRSTDVKELATPKGPEPQPFVPKVKTEHHPREVKMELISPKRRWRIVDLISPMKSSGKSPAWCHRGFVHARACDGKQREKIASLFNRVGWPRASDLATREAIGELLGLGGYKSTIKAGTYLAWVLSGKMQLVAAAILSVYRYRGKRRCGCLEFIVSKSRGAGSRLLFLAKRFLRSQNIFRLYSGVDLSRPYAMAAHGSWGFKVITQQEWAEAGLYSYSQGDVCYMLLDLEDEASRAQVATHQPPSEPN